VKNPIPVACTNIFTIHAIFIEKSTEKQKIQPINNNILTYRIYCHPKNKTVVSNHCVADYFRFRKHTSRNQE